MAKVITNVGTIVPITPATESQTRALMEIRDKGLYRDVLGYQTFEAYCKDRWDLSKMHAYRLMDSCRVMDTVKSDQLVTPSTESQARPLARLGPERQVYRDRVMDALARYEKIKSRKTGGGRNHEEKRF